MRPPEGFRYAGIAVPRPFSWRLNAARARHAAAYQAKIGVPLPLASFLCVLIESRLDQPGTWVRSVQQDARITGSYQPDRAVLPLLAPAALLDRIDGIAASRPGWTRVGVATALLAAGLDRLDADVERATAGDRRGARRVDTLVLSARPDVRWLTAAQRAALRERKAA